MNLGLGTFGGELTTSSSAAVPCKVESRAVNRCLAPAGVFCVLLLAVAVSSAEDIDPSLRERFLRAVPQTARIVEQISFRAKAVSTGEFESISDFWKAEYRRQGVDYDKSRVLEDVNSSIRGTFGLTTDVSRRGIETVAARNGDYAFRISRATAAKSYRLVFLERLGDNPVYDKRIQEEYDEARCHALGTWSVNSEPVSHIVESPSFQIKKVAAEKQDGVDLVRIEFDRLYTDPEQRPWSYSEAFLMCDPERHWALREYGYTWVDGRRQRTSVTFGEVIDGFSLAEKITRRETQNDGLTVSRQDITVELLSHDVPKEEFYLSHYGLPEPNFQRRGFGAWMWYLIAGIVCLGMATIIVKRRSVGQA